ncbi:MAG: DinB family protein [Anaerolineales bacterium]
MGRLKATPAEIEKYMLLLQDTLTRIRSCTQNADESSLHQSPGEKEWSAVQVLAHLRSCAEVWENSIYAMLDQDNPSLPLVDPRQWANQRAYDQLNFPASFQDFKSGRETLLKRLRALSPQEWQRSADIEGRRHTVFSQVRRMALHEIDHCAQIERLAGKRND